MGLIAELWLTGRVPAWDGLYRVDGTGCVDCGEGSHGFFARLDSDGGLLWVVALRESNPFGLRRGRRAVAAPEFGVCRPLSDGSSGPNMTA
ncbi:hypothetical protein ACFW3D_08825 [Streptomyces sp. NPDC058864]